MKGVESFKNGVFRYFVYLVWAFIFIVAVWDLFDVPYRSIIWFGSLIILVFLYFKFKKIPKYLYLLIIVLVLANMFGEIFSGFFYKYTHYDKFLHFLTPLLMCIFTYHAVRKKIQSKIIMALFCVFTALSLSVIWELFEYSIDTYLGGFMQGVYMLVDKNVFGFAARQTIDKLTDTMMDLFYDLAGTIVFILGFYVFNRKK